MKGKEGIPGNNISKQIHELKNLVYFINGAFTLKIHSMDMFRKEDDSHIFLKELWGETNHLYFNSPVY